MATNHYDVIVVGGGIVGASLAVALSERGQSVALIERDEIGGGTTARSFAWINATAKTADERYHRLNAAGLARYRELAAEFGERTLCLHPDGMLWCAPDGEPDRAAELRARADTLAGFGYPVTWLSAADLRAMEPHVAWSDGAVALYTMADAWIDAPAFARFQAGRLRSAGSAVFEHRPAVALLMDDDGTVRGVACADGDVLAGQVVLTCGPDINEVLAELTGFEGFATRFPVHRAAGLLVTTPDNETRQFARHILYLEGARSMHLRATSGGGLRLGADDTDGMVSEDPSPAVCREAALVLLDRAQRFLPTFRGRELIDDCRLDVGVRAVPADGMSIIGAMPGLPGLHVVATHSGVTLALAIAQWMADAVVHGEIAEEIAPFSLERFQGFA